MLTTHASGVVGSNQGSQGDGLGGVTVSIELFSMRQLSPVKKCEPKSITDSVGEGQLGRDSEEGEREL